MTKTHAEFLEELKKEISEELSYLNKIKLTEYGYGRLSTYIETMNKIEQFEEEQKQQNK